MMSPIDAAIASEARAAAVRCPLAQAAESLSLPAVVALHLLPGLLIGATFVLFARVLAPGGSPANLALLVAMLCVALPLELGGLLWFGRLEHGAWTLPELIASGKALPWRQALVLIPLLFVWSVAAYMLLAPLAELLRQTLFAWWPVWLRLDSLALHVADYDPAVLWTMVALSLVLNVAVPWVEELYFRGYLLPRMARCGRWAPLVNTALFSLYHVWLPWEFLSRLAALLPAISVVWWNRNLGVSVWVHVLLNSVGSVGLLVLVLSQP